MSDVVRGALMRHATPRRPGAAEATRRALRGFTLIELMVVVVLIGILAAMAAPRFGKAVQQVKDNVAVTNLKAIWAAERYYWIQQPGSQVTRGQIVTHLYADLPTLQSQNLIDSTLNNGNGPYTYTVVSNSNFTNDFTALATLNGGSTGFMISSLSVNGALSGQVTTLDGAAVYLPY